MSEKKKNKWDFSPDMVESFDKTLDEFKKPDNLWKKSLDIWDPKKKKE